MRISAEEIVSLYNERVKRSGAPQQVMREVASLYDGDIIVPLPEIQEDERPAIANIAKQGIDQTAQRIASVFPETATFPMSASRAELERARDRKRAFYGFHEQAKTQRKLRYAARYLIGYAQAPIRIRPDFAGERPWLDVRSPLGTYANPSGDPTEIVPSDCIFATRQTLGWLKHRHPDKYVLLEKKKTDDASTPIDVIEYLDANEIVLLVSRRIGEQGSMFKEFNEALAEEHLHLAGEHVELSRVPNRTGKPLVAIPGQISLSQQKSNFSQIVGMYQRASALDALAYLATRNAVLGETWLIANPSETPEILHPANPGEGEAGVVKGGTLQHRNVPVQFQERTAVSDLERAQRLTAGLPSELGGEAATNVRTGRRGDQLLSAVLDFPMAEAHEILQETIEWANDAMACVDYEYFPRSKKSFFVAFQGEKGKLDYEPGKLWRSPDGGLATGSKVSYFAAGLDANDRIISLGQRKGMGTMSDRTLMRHDPLVDDVEGELALIRGDQIDQVVLARAQELLANPQSMFSMKDMTALKRKVRDGLPIDEAMDDVMTAIEQRQQEQAQQQAAQQNALAAPNALAGAGAPGAPTPEAEIPPGIAPPPQDLQNLNSLLLSARGPSFATPQG